MTDNFKIIPDGCQPVTVGNGVKFLENLKGRDKAMRFAQYFARFLFFQTQNKKIQNFYKALGLHRKAFKLGTFVDEYIKFEQVLRNDPEGIKKNLKLLLRAFMAVFVIHDNMVWILSVKALQGDKDGIKQRSYYFRFIAAVLNFLLVCISYQETDKKLQQSSDVKTKEKQGENVLGLIKNTCDLMTYGTNTKWLPFLALNDGQMGILGALSALAGGFPVWLKLKP